MNISNQSTTEISTLVKKNYQRILDRIASLERYHSLKPKILELLEKPVLNTIDADICRNRLQAKAAKLANEGFISDAESLLDYLRLITKNYQPVSFLTAPGSRMNDHHSYPGGLVIHTATDIELALGMAHVYQDVYQLPIDQEILMIALTLHDIAKPSLYPWNNQGEYPDEIQIGGTGIHHILSLAEAIHRGFPHSIIKAMAFCHNRIIPPENGLERFLKAAFILADAPYPKKIDNQIELEDWLCLLADSDWPLTSWAMKQTINLQSVSMSRTDLLSFLSRESEFHVFSRLSK
jgi:hypothetical protein